MNSNDIKILIVEDNISDQHLMKEMLISTHAVDFKFKIAETLKDALKIIETNGIDVVLLDLCLPDSVGIETFRKIHNAYPKHAIVVTSMIADDQVALSTVKEGAQSFLFKDDITPAYLSRTIRYAVEKNRSEIASEEFTHMVVHELRAPLSIIKEGASQIMDGLHGALSDVQKKYISIMLNSAERMERLIVGLLEVTKLEQGRMKLKESPFDIVDTVRNTIAHFEPVITRRGLWLRNSLPRNSVIINGESDKISQVIANLMSNALKFTQKGGIEIRLIDNDNFVECSVQDSGCGIEAENISKVFDKFQQFKKPSYAEEKGTGLGLYISKSIIELHGGRISVRSAPMEGSTFTFTLPKAPNYKI